MVYPGSPPCSRGWSSEFARADSSASMSQRNSLPTRMGLGSHVCLPGWRAQRRSTSGWMPRCSAAVLVLTHRRSGAGVEGSSRIDASLVVVDIDQRCAVQAAVPQRRGAIAEKTRVLLREAVERAVPKAV